MNNVPDIDSSPLPLAPDDNFKKVLASPVEIRQYAEKTSSQRVKRALFSTFSSDDVTTTINLSSPKKENLTIDGISPALIDKVHHWTVSNRLFIMTISTFSDPFERDKSTSGI